MEFTVKQINTIIEGDDPVTSVYDEEKLWTSTGDQESREIILLNLNNNKFYRFIEVRLRWDNDYVYELEDKNNNEEIDLPEVEEVEEIIKVWKDVNKESAK